MFQCPICGEIVEFLTNNHCQTRHNMSRKELERKYGKAEYNPPLLTKQVAKWINENTVALPSHAFDSPQAAIRGFYK